MGAHRRDDCDLVVGHWRLVSVHVMRHDVAVSVSGQDSGRVYEEREEKSISQMRVSKIVLL